MADSAQGRNWFRRHKVLTAGLAVVALIIVIGAAANAGGKDKAGATRDASSATAVSGSSGTTGTSSGSATSTTVAATTSTTVASTTTVPRRVVKGKQTTLGAGNFLVGRDIPPGIYDVTAGTSQSGNFIVTGEDSYNEILGSADGMGVPKVRVRLRKGDKVQLDSLSAARFTPVTSPYVTTVKTVNLYAGTWTVGKDLAPGRYVATPGAGQSGNFIVDAEGVDEILGKADGMGVPSVTTTLRKGDVIDISGMAKVVMTPK